MIEGKRRETEVRYHVLNLPRSVKVPKSIAIKRVLRLGKCHSRRRASRPTLVEFGNPRHRNGLLAPADRIKAKTRGLNNIEPNDTAISKTNSKAAKWNNQDSLPQSYKSLNCESTTWMRKGS